MLPLALMQERSEVAFPSKQERDIFYAGMKILRLCALAPAGVIVVIELVT